MHELVQYEKPLPPAAKPGLSLVVVHANHSHPRQNFHFPQVIVSARSGPGARYRQPITGHGRGAHRVHVERYQPEPTTPAPVETRGLPVRSAARRGDRVTPDRVRNVELAFVLPWPWIV